MAIFVLRSFFFRIKKIFSGMVVIDKLFFRIGSKVYWQKIILHLDCDVDRAIFCRAFENEAMDYFLGSLRKGMTVFDIGANIGYYTLAASLGVGENGSIHSFEPAPAAYARLQSNILINKRPNVVINNLAVCDRSGEVCLNVTKDCAYSSITANPMRDIVNRISVPCTTLDEYVKFKNIKTVDIIKIDAEGADFLVLKGGRNSVDRFHPLLFLEYNRKIVKGLDFSLLDLEGLLKEMGYDIFKIRNHKLSPFKNSKDNDSEIVAADSRLLPRLFHGDGLAARRICSSLIAGGMRTSL